MFAVCSFNLYSSASGKSMDGMFCKLAEMAGLGVNGARWARMRKLNRRELQDTKKRKACKHGVKYDWNFTLNKIRFVQCFSWYVSDFDILWIFTLIICAIKFWNFVKEQLFFFRSVHCIWMEYMISHDQKVWEVKSKRCSEVEKGENLKKRSTGIKWGEGRQSSLLWQDQNMAKCSSGSSNAWTAAECRVW